ncbi:MAG TPA: alpha/beta fold hydrolase, partial [Candidatus Hydrogenedentes bacterium]|nr:alpha/beta fold hydrolase [Candidatus Hydrogenedentota bacterium]
MTSRRKRWLAAFLVLGALLIAAALLAFFATRRVTGDYFDSNGVRIHYTVEGAGDPVILVHGFAANADLNWRLPGVTKALAKEFRVIALDNRGHGLSDKPHDPQQYGAEMIEDVVRLMDHLGIEK